MIHSCACCGIELENHRSSFTAKEDECHRFCLSCASSEMMKVPLKLRNFLDELNAPVVMVDDAGLVQVANIHTSQLLHKHLSCIEGHAGGDVFECAYSKLPERCGNTIHCSGCTIRNAVMDTHATGKPLLKIPAILKQAADGEPQDLHCYISTEKLDKYVILTISCLTGMKS